MVIKQESINHDLKGLVYRIGQIDPETVLRPQIYCDRKDFSPADTERIRSVLQLLRKHPTFIYLAGHTEPQPSGGQLAYIPADCLDASNPDQLQYIPYDTIRSWLLDGQHTAPLLFVTEVCRCDNFLRLPYVLKREGKEMRWERTEFYSTFEGSSNDIVHFAATSPGEFSASYESTGAIFTKALYNINWSEMLSLKEIVEQLQDNIDAILSSRGDQDDHGRDSQHPVVYCSRIMDEPHFFATLGFCSSSTPGSRSVSESHESVEEARTERSHLATPSNPSVEAHSTQLGSSPSTIREGKNPSRSSSRWKRLCRAISCGLIG